jgi:hypothetical protein
LLTVMLAASAAMLPVRQAFVASLVFAPPKASESRRV